jgi:hypothetical protein
MVRDITGRGGVMLSVPAEAWHDSALASILEPEVPAGGTALVGDDGSGAVARHHRSGWLACLRCRLGAVRENMYPSGPVRGGAVGVVTFVRQALVAGVAPVLSGLAGGTLG